ncbi:MAG: CRISPR-associated protein Csx15 [Anaerolineae bacterium]
MDAPKPPTVYILNYAHPLAPAHLARVEALTGRRVERVVEVASHVDVQQSLARQIVEMADNSGLSPAEWQTLPLVINPPALNYSAVALLAELHGRMGYFAPVVRLRPVADSLPVEFEVAEIINLQALREAARTRR